MGPRAALGSTALLVLLALTGCVDQADPRTPAEQVADAVDNFAADNTGRYTLSVETDDATMREDGHYRVAPDASATMRRFTSPEGTGLVRYLRLGPAVWVELPGVVDTSGTGDREPRTGCWLHGTADAIHAVEGSPAGGAQLSSAAVEVPLGLENGRREGERLVADASLRTVAAALGFSVARRLALPTSRVHVPVTLTLEDSRITRWEVDLADVDGAGPGSVVATFTDPGDDVPLAPPEESADVSVIDVEASPDDFARLPARCS